MSKMELLDLHEDVLRLLKCYKLLAKVNPNSLPFDHGDGQSTSLSAAVHLIRSWHREANRMLARELAE